MMLRSAIVGFLFSTLMSMLVAFYAGTKGIRPLKAGLYGSIWFIVIPAMTIKRLITIYETHQSYKF